MSRSVKNYRKIQERTGTESITKVMRSSAKRKNRQMPIADLFEDMGVDVMHTSQEEDGWHVYFD